MKIKRDLILSVVRAALGRSRSVGLVGPRQCGKSTLARELAELESASCYLDLEDPSCLSRLHDPKLALERLTGLVIIDEVQRMPELMPLLRVLLDRKPLPARFLLLGSASPMLIRNASESLAGRIEFIEMGGFSLDEIGAVHKQSLWLRGGFPLSWLSADDGDSLKWRESFLQAFMERDLSLLGIDLPPIAVRRFLTMLAHSHAQTWNASEIGRSIGVAHTTAQRYLDAMSGALLIRQLPPWFENVGKRVIKAPKVYLRDSGLMHALLGIERFEQLESHPKLGASWEGFALEQTLRWSGDRHAFFWGTYGGAELDLCLMDAEGRIGFEFKYTSSPSTSKSMQVALRDLKLDHIHVVHPGEGQYPLKDKITATGLAEIKGVIDKHRPKFLPIPPQFPVARTL